MITLARGGGIVRLWPTKNSTQYINWAPTLEKTDLHDTAENYVAVNKALAPYELSGWHS